MDSNGLITLLLAIPISIAANLLTPVVKDWFASFSQKRLERRIKKLERQLEILNKRDVLLEVLRYLIPIFSMLGLIAIGLHGIVEVLASPENSLMRDLTSLCAAFVLILCFTNILDIHARASGTRREYLEKTIPILKTKLEKKSLAAKN